jgi:hypothetical protein
MFVITILRKAANSGLPSFTKVSVLLGTANCVIRTGGYVGSEHGKRPRLSSIRFFGPWTMAFI